MLDLVLRYAATFTAHALLGGAIVLFATWLLYRLGAAMGWNRHGERGPRWLAAVFRVCGVVVLLVAVVTTALQTGSIHALARAVEEGAQQLVLDAALEVGQPLGIASADQKLSLADAERLVARFAPELVERSRDQVEANELWRRAGNYWEAMPGALQDWIKRKGPRTETTPRELVRYAWRSGAAPLVESTKWQALIFAYTVALLMVLSVAVVEWLWLAYTRGGAAAVSAPSANPP
jgi:hypothetical protein